MISEQSARKRYLQARRRVVAAGIVLVGSATGLVLYVTASTTDNALADQVTETKQYQRQMESVAAQERRCDTARWRDEEVRSRVTRVCLARHGPGRPFIASTR